MRRFGILTNTKAVSRHEIKQNKCIQLKLNFNDFLISNDENEIYGVAIISQSNVSIFPIWIFKICWLFCV